MPFSFTKTALPDVILIENKLFKDDRGYFSETYKQSDFTAAGIQEHFVQDNFSYSTTGVLRGLHYQKAPHGQGKLVAVLKGEIFDVAVDIRKGSSTYGKWIGVTLSAVNARMLFIPSGFAHGFCVTSADALVTYKVTTEYDHPSERGILWNDPDVGVDWPVRTPVLSPKDAILPRLCDADNNFTCKD